MLKIAIFTDALLNSTSPPGQCAFQLAKLLAEQQNQVSLISSEKIKGGKPTFAIPENLPNSLEIYFPFSSWGIHELPLGAFFLSRLAPDIIHIFQAESRHSIFSAYPLLSDCLDFTRRPVKFFSLFSLPHKPSTHITYPTLRSDAVIVQSQDLKSRLQHFFPGVQDKIHCVPMTPPSSQKVDSTSALIDIPSTETLVVIPCSVSDLFDPEGTLLSIQNCLLQKPDLHFAFTGSWGSYSPFRRNLFWRKLLPQGISSRLHFVGNDEAPQLLQNNKNIYYWLSPLDPLKADITQKLHSALRAHAIPLLIPEVTPLNHPDWQIVRQHLQCGPISTDLLKVLEHYQSHPQKKTELHNALSRLLGSALIDHPANEISRLYHAHRQKIVY